MTAIVTKKKQK